MNTAAPTSVELPTNENTVIVNTPIAEITISLVGGDITRVRLKDYPVSLKAPEQPIALLDTIERIYIAQTGLVGPDGPDASTTGRPIYTATQSTYNVTQPTTIVIQADTKTGLALKKLFSINPNKYDIGVTLNVTNNSNSQKEVTPFVQLKRDNSVDP